MNITGQLNGESVKIVSQQGSGDQIYTSYLTSAGQLKITRKAIGIDDIEQIATNSTDNSSSTSGVTANVRKFDEYALLVVGDSITNQESKTSTNEYNSGFNNFTSIGAVSWMNYILKDQSFQRTYYRGRSGLQATELFTSARSGWNLPAISQSCSARHVLIGLGTNDVNAGGTTSEQASAAIYGIAKFFKDEGRTVHIKSIYPRRVADASWTNALQLKQLRLNKYIQMICVQLGCEYVPVSECLTDFTQTSAYLCSANGIRSTYDAIHVNNYGAMIQGLTLADHFKSRSPNFPKSGPLHYLDDVSQDSTSQNLVKNPLFAIASGPSTSAWTVATSYGGGTVTSAIVPSPDGVGYALQFDVSGVSAAPSSTSTLIFQTFGLTSAMKVSGNNLVGSMRVKLSQYGSSAGAPVQTYYPWMHASVTNNGTSGWGAIAGMYGDSGNNSPLDRPIDLLIKTPPLTFTGIETAFSTLLRIGVLCGVGAAFRVVFFSPTIQLNSDPYGGKKDFMWTDNDPPAYPAV